MNYKGRQQSLKKKANNFYLSQWSMEADYKVSIITNKSSHFI